MRAPYVSIIIPAWNEGEALEQTLGRLAELEYPGERLEIIIVAGGTDSTYDIAAGYAGKMRKLSRYTVLRQKPLGKNAAIMQGIAALNGNSEFVVLLDADITVEKSCLASAVKYIAENGVEVAGTNYFPVDVNYVSIYWMYEKTWKKMIKSNILYGGGGIMFKRRILDRESPRVLFNPAIIGLSDVVFSRELGQKYRFGFMDDVKVKTHIPGSMRYFLKDLIRVSIYRANSSAFPRRFFITSAVFSASLISLSVFFLINGLKFGPGVPVLLSVVSIPFLAISYKTISKGLRVYRYAGDRIFLRFLWSYLLLNYLLRLLFLFISILAVLHILKPEIHFKGSRSNCR